MQQSFVELVLTKAPILFLGVAMLLLFFFTVPNSNHDEMLSIVSGFLGLLTGRAMASVPSPPKPPAKPDSGPVT